MQVRPDASQLSDVASSIHIRKSESSACNKATRLHQKGPRNLTQKIPTWRPTCKKHVLRFHPEAVQVSPGTRSQVWSLTPKRRVESGSNPGHRSPVSPPEGATWSRRRRCSRSMTTGRSFFFFSLDFSIRRPFHRAESEAHLQQRWKGEKTICNQEESMPEDKQNSVENQTFV